MASGAAASVGGANRLDFLSGFGDLAPATHVASRRIGYCRIARAGSYPGRIPDPFNSAPLRRYDATGGGGDSIELNRGDSFVRCGKLFFLMWRRTCVAGIMELRDSGGLINKK